MAILFEFHDFEDKYDMLANCSDIQKDIDFKIIMWYLSAPILSVFVGFIPMYSLITTHIFTSCTFWE